MAFEKGQAKPENSGKVKGTLNKRNLDALAIAKEHKVCPITFWCNVVNDKYPEADFEHKMAAIKELAPYLFPKLKQIEHTGEGGSDLFARLLSGINGTKP